MMIAPTPFFANRGCHVRIYEEARALQARGHRVVIFTYHHGDEMPDVLTRRIGRMPWYDKLSPGPSYHMLYMDIMLLQKVLRWVPRLDPDLIHAHLHEGAFIAQWAHRIYKTPYLFDAQGSLTGEMRAHGFIAKRSLSHRFFRRLERAIVDHAPLIAASSKTLAQTFINDFGAPEETVAVLHDGVDSERFSPDKGNGSLRARYGIPAKHPIVVYLGGLDAHKGVDTLLAAIPEVLKRHWRTHFLILGYPHIDAYRHRVAVRGLSDTVTVDGPIDYDDAARYLATADIAVAPKPLRWGESNGKLFNYMGCALSVVALDHPVNREILGEDGVYVYAVENDARSFADAIVALLSDPDDAKRRGRRLREKAKERFDWRHRAQELEQLYARLLSPSGNGDV